MDSAYNHDLKLPRRTHPAHKTYTLAQRKHCAESVRGRKLTTFSPPRSRASEPVAAWETTAASAAATAQISDPRTRSDRVAFPAYTQRRTHSQSAHVGESVPEPRRKCFRRSVAEWSETNTTPKRRIFVRALCSVASKSTLRRNASRRTIA